jgi:RNA polymerase sigma-70 factor (ECF subfamily)
MAMIPRGTAAAKLDLDRLRERRPEAIEAWFASYVAVVHGFVRRRVAVCPDLADDVTQDTFLAALRQIENFDPERGAMLPWLTYIARNCARKALRERARIVGFMDGANDPAVSHYPPMDDAPLPDELLMRDETVERVHAALASISSPHQRVLERYYVLQQPLKQIARDETTTVGATKSLLHRARLAFKAAFEAGADTEALATALGRFR